MQFQTTHQPIKLDRSEDYFGQGCINRAKQRVSKFDKSADPISVKSQQFILISIF
jgi:hypothetical protein